MAGLDGLAEKIGPLPVWGWAIGIAGLAGVGVLLTRQGSTQAPATRSSLDAMGYQTSGIQGGTASAPTTVGETNLGWVSRVSRLVADTLSVSPSDVNAALYKYVTGQALTTVEKTYVDAGINYGTAPPEGVQGVSEVTTKPARTFVSYIRKVNGKISGLYSDNTTDSIDSLAEWKSLEQQGATFKSVSNAEYDGYKAVS